MSVRKAKIESLVQEINRIMEEEDVDPRICRICQEKKFLVDMQEDENYHLLEKLQEIEGVKKKTDFKNFDEVFKYICRSCESALEGFFEFRNRVRKMRKKLMHAAVTGRIAVPAEPATSEQTEGTEVIAKEVPQQEDTVKDELTDAPIFVAEPEFIVMDYLEEGAQISHETPEKITWEEVGYVTTHKMYRQYPKVPQEDKKGPPECAKEDKIACSQCKPEKREFPDQKALADHIGKDHAPKSRECPTCGRSFSVISNFLDHLKLHSCSNFQCRYCKRVYKSKLNWEIHELGHRTEEKEAQDHLKVLRETRAKALNLKIKSIKAYKAHKATLKKNSQEKTDAATAEKPEEPKDPRGTECTVCNGWYRNMNLHMRVHRSKIYTCYYCYEKFKTKGLLRFHTKLNHVSLGYPKKK